VQRHARTDPGPDQHREPTQRRRGDDHSGPEGRRTAPVRRVNRVHGDELQHRGHQQGRQIVVRRPVGHGVPDRGRRTTAVRQRCVRRARIFREESISIR